MMRKFFIPFIVLIALGLVLSCGGQKEEAAEEESMEQMEKTVGEGMVMDPVCDVEVDTSKVKIMAENEGKTYYFCCDSCKQEFVANPEMYVEEKEMEEGY